MRFSCASAFAHSFEQLLKKITSSYIYVRQERSSSETNDRAPCTLKKAHFYEKKKDKGKERKKGGKAVRTNWKLFFVALLALGAVPGEYITYPLLPGK